MVNYSETLLNSTFSALSDPTRRAILSRLARGEASVTELAEPFDVSLPAISKHLQVLENAGLLAREKNGRVHRCHLVSEPLKDAADWIARYRAFWERQFDALANYLTKPTGKEEAVWQTGLSARKRHSRSEKPSRLRGRKSSKLGRYQKS